MTVRACGGKRPVGRLWLMGTVPAAVALFDTRFRMPVWMIGFATGVMGEKLRQRGDVPIVAPRRTIKEPQGVRKGYRHEEDIHRRTAAGGADQGSHRARG